MHCERELFIFVEASLSIFFVVSITARFTEKCCARMAAVQALVSNTWVKKVCFELRLLLFNYKMFMISAFIQVSTAFANDN